jgi:hypothetical protein
MRWNLGPHETWESARLDPSEQIDDQFPLTISDDAELSLPGALPHLSPETDPGTSEMPPDDSWHDIEPDRLEPHWRDPDLPIIP